MFGVFKHNIECDVCMAEVVGIFKQNIECDVCMAEVFGVFKRNINCEMLLDEVVGFLVGQNTARSKALLTDQVLLISSPWPVRFFSSARWH